MIRHPERLIKIDERLIECLNRISARTEKELDRNIIIIFGKRTTDEQQKLYDQGRTTPGRIVTDAKPGESAHEYYAAIDTWVLSKDEKSVDWANDAFKKIMKEEVEKSPDLKWGGKFPKPDHDHIETIDWKQLKNQIT